jgi:hypothetical protein
VIAQAEDAKKPNIPGQGKAAEPEQSQSHHTDHKAPARSIARRGRPRAGWYVACALFWLFWIAFFVSTGNSSGQTVTFAGIFVALSLFWYVAGRKLEPARALLFFLSIERKLASFGRKSAGNVKDGNESSSRNQQYFFGEEEFPSIPARAFRVFISVLGLAAWFAGMAGSNAKSGYEVLIFAVLFTIPLFLVLPFILFPIWVYEDSGLRHYDKLAGTISTPGGTIKDALTGGGVVLTVGAFTLLTNDIPNFGNFIVIISAPSLLAAVLFSYDIEPRLIAKFRDTSLVKGIPKGEIFVSETASSASDR